MHRDTAGDFYSKRHICMYTVHQRLGNPPPGMTTIAPQHCLTNGSMLYMFSMYLFSFMFILVNDCFIIITMEVPRLSRKQQSIHTTLMLTSNILTHSYTHTLRDSAWCQSSAWCTFSPVESVKADNPHSPATEQSGLMCEPHKLIRGRSFLYVISCWALSRLRNTVSHSSRIVRPSSCDIWWG